MTSRVATGPSDIPLSPELSVRRTPGDTIRILYSYQSPHLDTGSPRALVSVVEALDRPAFQPVFLHMSDGPLIDALAARGTELVHGSRASVSLRHPIKSIRDVRRQLEVFASQRIDILHLHEPGWNYDLVVAAALRRIPVVLHVHNPVAVERRNVDWALATRVVFVSEAHRASTKRLDRIQSRSTVIYNAVDLDRFANGTPQRESLGLAPDDFVVGVVSQVSHRKGIDVLLDAAAKLIPRHPKLVFVVAGPAARGERNYANDMLQRAGEAAFDGRVRFLGPRSDIPDILATCDLFFLPARAEPLGIAIIEAMAAGLPVVASHVGGIPEIITSPALGSLVPELTGDAFAEAIDAVIRLPDRGRAMGRAGAASLANRFDPATIAAQWRAFYASLVSSPRRGA